MKKIKGKNILAALGVALALTNTTTSYAYSNDKLDQIEESLESYIDEEIENKEASLDDYIDRYFHIQALISKIPTEYYYELVDSIDTYKTLKDTMKACIGPDMCDAAKEAIIYANIAENQEELLYDFTMFFDSRYNGKSFNETEENGYSLSDINVLDNREGKLDIGKSFYVFRRVSSYGDYKIYTFSDSSYAITEQYYFITNSDNKVLAYIKGIDYQLSYRYVGDKGVYISEIKPLLTDNGLNEEIKNSYTYEDIYELTFKISEAMDDESKSSVRIKAEDLYTIIIPYSQYDRPYWFNSLSGNEENQYFFAYECPYQFKEDTNVYRDIYNPDANITIDKDGTYGLQYYNYVTDVYMRLCNSKNGEEDYERLLPINDFLRLHNCAYLIKDEYTKADLDNIKKIFTPPTDVKKYILD